MKTELTFDITFQGVNKMEVRQALLVSAILFVALQQVLSQGKVS